jgi:hypothetical protein
LLATSCDGKPPVGKAPDPAGKPFLFPRDAL